MNKIRVIDLLNKIANGEEVPEKIKYENYIYWYNKNLKDYENAQVEFTSYLISCRYHTTDFLNDEVEIIEDTPSFKGFKVKDEEIVYKEDKKIEKLDLLFEDKFIKEQFKSGSISYLSDYTTLKMIYEKQCEIIDKINGE